MVDINLIQSNNYDVANAETGHAITNMFINQSGKLETFWGYRRLQSESFISKEIEASYVDSANRYVILVDIDGVMIIEKIGDGALGDGIFDLAFPKLYFKDARIKTSSGEDKYGNGKTYTPDGNKVSIIENQNEMIFITDGSIGGLYILTISQDRKIFFGQFDYDKMNGGDPASLPPGYIFPYINDQLVHCINPSSLDFLNPHLIVVDNRSNLQGEVINGYMYVITNMTVKEDPDGSGKLIPDYKTGPEDNNKPEMTAPYSMVNPIIAAKVVNGMVYAISYDKIDLYQYGDILPLLKVQNATIEIGCISRNLLTTFNGKLIFIGSSKDKRFALNVIVGGSGITEINKNNLSYVFTHYLDNISSLTVSAFGTHYQEFAIINGFRSISLLVDLTPRSESSQNSFFIQDFNGKRFLADQIFQFKNDYYCISYDDNGLYEFSDKIRSFGSNPIVVSVRSQQFFTLSHKLWSIQNFQMVLQSLSEDKLNLNPSKLIPYLEDPRIATYEIFIKGSDSKGWVRVNKGGEFFTILNDNPSDFIGSPIQVDTRLQIKILIHPKKYEYLGVEYFSPVIVNSMQVELIGG